MVEDTNRTASSDSKVQMCPPLFSLFQNDLFWAPYRGAAQAIGQAQRNFAQMVQMNRKLADTLREIVRQEQDVLLNLSEGMMHKLAADGETPGEEMGASSALFRTAVEGTREFSQALVDGQNRSAEALREYTKVAMETGRTALSENLNRAA